MSVSYTVLINLYIRMSLPLSRKEGQNNNKLIEHLNFWIA